MTIFKKNFIHFLIKDSMKIGNTYTFSDTMSQDCSLIFFVKLNRSMCLYILIVKVSCMYTIDYKVQILLLGMLLLLSEQNLKKKYMIFNQL